MFFVTEYIINAIATFIEIAIGERITLPQKFISNGILLPNSYFRYSGERVQELIILQITNTDIIDISEERSNNFSFLFLK